MDVRFMAAGGTTECSPWSAAAAEVPFEQCPPLKPFPVRKGKRMAPGWWWSATTGRLVHYGSGAMRLHVMLLDHDPRVTYLASQPLELRWRERERDEVRTHVPQMMLRLADGQGVLADCIAGEELSQGQRSLAAMLGEVCAAVGWRYWVLGPVDPVYRRNVAWLAGYRHPRYHGGQQVAAALRKSFAGRTPLWEGVRGTAGDPMVVLPALFHALWAGRLSADLGAPMHERMPVWARSA
ncbi:TnsA-like heteromeric transposase endonuclease subunit [Streptomyces sp. 372A]